MHMTTQKVDVFRFFCNMLSVKLGYDRPLLYPNFMLLFWRYEVAVRPRNLHMQTVGLYKFFQPEVSLFELWSQKYNWSLIVKVIWTICVNVLMHLKKPMELEKSRTNFCFWLPTCRIPSANFKWKLALENITPRASDSIRWGWKCSFCINLDSNMPAKIDN